MDQFEEIRKSLEDRLRYQAGEIEKQILSHEQGLAELRRQQELLPHQILRATRKLPEKAYCPSCWILFGTLERLTSLNGGNNFDLFRCEKCPTEIEVPF